MQIALYTKTDLNETESLNEGWRLYNLCGWQNCIKIWKYCKLPGSLKKFQRRTGFNENLEVLQTDQYTNINERKFKGFRNSMVGKNRFEWKPTHFGKKL